MWPSQHKWVNRSEGAGVGPQTGGAGRKEVKEVKEVARLPRSRLTNDVRSGGWVCKVPVFTTFVGLVWVWNGAPPEPEV